MRGERVNQLEILEFAAKAAGWMTRRYSVRELTVVHVRENETANWRMFDSLKSPLDAFELAAAARIDLMHASDYVTAYAGAGVFRNFAYDEVEPSNDAGRPQAARMRAACRAITECALKIGRDLGAPWWRTL
jgi:hypothetical protein